MVDHKAQVIRGSRGEGMKLFEYQGKGLFSKFGIPIPSGKRAENAEEALSVFRELSKPVVLKAQVYSGGRGKAGGVKMANTEDEVLKAAHEILGMDIHGFITKEILVEEVLDIAEEFYLGITVNSMTRGISLMFSPRGGMDVEQAAGTDPGGIMSWDFGNLSNVREYEIRNCLKRAGLNGKVLIKTASVASKLCTCFSGKDLLLAEVNPLVVTKNGELVAADAKAEVDDNALFRHEEFDGMTAEISDPFEREAAEIGVSYVSVGGNIGIIASGAGLAMDTMDIIDSKGYKAANFLETGGGITAKLISGSLDLLLSNPVVKGIIVNLYGGVNPMEEAAKGIAEALESTERNVPLVVKLLGNRQEEAWRILEEKGVPTVKDVRTENAVDELIRMMESGAVR